MTEAEKNLSKHYNTSNERYIYFLLAVSASAIGYAMTQLQKEPFNLNHIAFFLSVSLWSLSFLAGLKLINTTNQFIFHNINYLSFERKFGSHPSLIPVIKEAEKGLLQNNSKTNKTIKIYRSIQHATLLMGAVSYISWHALTMLSTTT